MPTTVSRNDMSKLIPVDFGGAAICDRCRSYDAKELEGVAQQKCLAHLIRNCTQLIDEKTGQARQFGRQLKDILQRALLLPADQKNVGPKAWRKQVEALEMELTDHLRARRLRDQDSQRLLNGVGAQHDRGHELRFLRKEVEPTNNRGERDQRPGVIARKVSHCSKKARGAMFICSLHQRYPVSSKAQPQLHNSLSRQDYSLSSNTYLNNASR